MRYKIDDKGYITSVYFNCHTGTCNEYTGEIPSGYETLLEWSEKANIQAYKIVDGNLVYDSNRDEELRFIHEQEAEENTTATRGWVKNKLNSANSVVVDEISKNATGTALVKIDDSGEYEIPIITLSSSTDGRVDVVSSNKNLLGIDTLTKTINGVKFTINADGSMTLNGASTADIELDLKGTSTNIEMLFLIKGGLDYTISGLANNVSLNLYNYDGTDRTLIGSYNNKTINLSSSEIVTYSTLYITSGKTFSNVTISPQVELGKTATPFTIHDESRTTITIKNGAGISNSDLQSYEPITVLMTNKEVNIDVDYYMHKYLETKFTEIEKTNDEIRLSVESMNDEFQPIADVYGIGELSLHDNAGEDLLEFIVEGKSEQKKYTGKNLFDYITTLKTSTGGLTNTINPDGSITTTGILSTNYIALCANQDITDILEDGQTYTAWQENLNGGSNLRLIVYINDKATNKTASYVILEGVNSKSFTVDKTKYFYTINVQTDTTTTWGTSNRTFTNKYMLVKGNNTTFEPYVGRTSSPNPNYPSEIKNISGIENLFSIDDTTTPTKIIDGEVTITTAAYDPTKFLIKVSKNQPYTLSFINDNASSTYPIRLQVKESDSSGNAGTKIADDTINYTSKHARTITPTTEYIIIEMFRGVASSEPTIINEIQLEKGATVHSFVPYGSNYLIEKVVGKNKFDYSKIIRNANINSSGTVISSTPNGNYTVNLNYVEVKPDMTYVLSSNISRQWVYNFFSEMPAIGVTGTSRIVKNGINQTFTTPSDAKYIVIREDVSFDGSVERNDNQEIQLEEKVQTEYEEYKEAISLIDLKNNLHDLCSIGNAKDELVVKDGRGTINKKIWKLVLRGNENWNSTGGGVFWLNRGTYNRNGDFSAISNSYNYSTWENRFNGYTVGLLYLTDWGNSRLFIHDENYSTVDEFKAYLQKRYDAGKPVIIQFELATPTTINLGDVSVKTIQGDCTLTLEEELDTNIYAKYIRNTPYNEVYMTRSEAKAEIKITKEGIESKVSKDDVVSTINQSAEQITLTGNRVVIESDNFNLHADGTIEATGGTVGGFSMNDEEFYTQIYAPYDFTVEDRTKVREYLKGEITLTDAEKAKYDIDGDGIINTRDYLAITNFLVHNITTTTPATLKINSKDIWEIMSLKNGNGKDVFRLGLFGIEAANIVDTYDCGRDTFATEANTTVSYEVYFKKEFISAPSVTLTQVTSNPNNTKKVSVGNITNEKFEVFIYDTSNSSVTLCWTVIGDE